MDKKVLALCLLLGLFVLAECSSPKLEDLQGEYQSRSGLDDDDDDDDEKRPYSFAWEASRHYHGAPDREHKEERGADGVTRGVFRYVDPSLRVQEVIYTADDKGFRIENPSNPDYTDAQIAERQRHAQLFQEIAEEHSRIGSEHSLRAAELGYEPQTYDAPIQVEYPDGNVDPASLPQFTPVLEKARNLHQDLFERIRAQHARIAAERKTNPADEETGEPYEYQYDTPLKTVEVVSGSVGPNLLTRSASVVAPGADHPDFQGYGVPLGTFRDDITEEEALMLLMQADAAHIERFQSEADLHEALVLEGPGAVGSRLNQAGLSRSADASGGFRHSASGSTKSLSSSGSGNRRQENANLATDRKKANSFNSQAASSFSSNNQGSVGHANSQPSQSGFASQQQSSGANDQILGISQGTRANTRNQRTAAGGQYSGNQDPLGASRPTQFNAANQGTTTNVQYNAGNQGASKTGHYNKNQSATSLSQSAPDIHGSQANKYSSTNDDSAHDSSSHGDSSSRQHAGATSAAAGKFSSNPRANVNINTEGTNQGRPQASSNQGSQRQSQSQFSSFGGGNKQPSVGQHQSTNVGQSKFTANVGQATRPSHYQPTAGGQQQNLQHQFNVPAGQTQSPGHNQHSNSGRAQTHVGQGTSITGNRQAGTGAHYDKADQEAALAVIAEQRDNHLRQFRKIAKAHEEIGDEHHQLTLAALQKQRMKIQAW
ncbi:Insect cuticle protein [Trinorchestia longiramus]|nr:Insect cuticle protein [Trinorchestia longiramus]